MLYYLHYGTNLEVLHNSSAFSPTNIFFNIRFNGRFYLCTGAWESPEQSGRGRIYALEPTSSSCKKHFTFDFGRYLGWSSDVCFKNNWWIHIYISFSYINENILSSNDYRRYNSVLPKSIINRPKKLVSYVVARIS